MTKVFSTRSGVLRLLLTFFLLVTITLTIPLYMFTTTNLDSVKYREAKILADSTKKVYYKKLEILDTLNGTLDEYMYLKLLSTKDAIKRAKKVDKQYLISLAKKQNVTGIWLIEPDGYIRISSEGKVINAKHWYTKTDRPDVEWDKILKKLTNEEGAYWIDPNYSRRHLPPHEIYKWGYMGIGEVKNIGKVVLEVGVSIEDILNTKALVRDKLAKYNTGTGIVDVRMVRKDPTNPQGLDSQFDSLKLKTHLSEEEMKTLKGNREDFAYRQEKQGNKIVTYLSVDDKLINSESMMVVTTEHADVTRLETIITKLILIAPLAVLVMYLVMLYALGKPKRRKKKCQNNQSKCCQHKK